MSKMHQSFPTWTFDEPCTSMAWTEPSNKAGVALTASTVTSADATLLSLREGADLIIVGVTAPSPKKGGHREEEEEEEKEEEPVVLEGLVAAINDELGGALKDVMEENRKDFQNGAKLATTTPTLRIVSQTGSKRYVAMGLGRSSGDTAAIGFKLGKAVVETCNAEKKVATAHVLLPPMFVSNIALIRDFATGFHQELYSDNRYRTGSKVKHVAEHLQKVVLHTVADIVDEALTAALEEGKKLALGVFMARDIVNAPHNVLNSISLADTARRVAADSDGRLQCTILDKNECEERGMGAYLGVARASETEPQFIHLTYKPADGNVKKKVACVGKGLLFDTGGYNIKAQMMELMKFDTGGAAAVLGAARAVAALAPAGVEAHFVVAACENMINHKGIVPSDILTASNGKTIEVMNTDAEGRLTLADALVYADKELGCESIIELSTLTGSCMVALGTEICGIWTANDELAEQLADISRCTGEQSWRMPLPESYNEQLESKIADIKNIGTRFGGSITAALFLRHFVDSKKPFAHIDVAGPVWDHEKGCATGFGAKLVTEWVARQGK